MTEVSQFHAIVCDSYMELTVRIQLDLEHQQRIHQAVAGWPKKWETFRKGGCRRRAEYTRQMRELSMERRKTFCRGSVEDRPARVIVQSSHRYPSYLRASVGLLSMSRALRSLYHSSLTSVCCHHLSMYILSIPQHSSCSNTMAVAHPSLS